MRTTTVLCLSALFIISLPADAAQTTITSDSATRTCTFVVKKPVEEINKNVSAALSAGEYAPRHSQPNVWEGKKDGACAVNVFVTPPKRNADGTYAVKIATSTDKCGAKSGERAREPLNQILREIEQ